MAFEIHEITAGGGWIALGQMPGLEGAHKEDIGRLVEWRAGMVVSLVGSEEALRLGVELPEKVLASVQDVEWAHFPIQDYVVPDEIHLAVWGPLSVKMREILRHGGRVFVHCRGGCGRSGMIVLRLLIELGEAPEEALTRLRAVRGCAVETAEQLAWASR